MCLGHQVLCGALGLELGYKDIVFQGTQTKVGILGRQENVGFYNTFVARARCRRPCRPASRSTPTRRPVTSTCCGDRTYVGVQFHAESILTENGFDLVHELVLDLVDVQQSSADSQQSGADPRQSSVDPGVERGPPAVEPVETTVTDTLRTPLDNGSTCSSSTTTTPTPTTWST